MLFMFNCKCFPSKYHTTQNEWYIHWISLKIDRQMESNYKYKTNKCNFCIWKTNIVMNVFAFLQYSKKDCIVNG